MSPAQLTHLLSISWPYLVAIAVAVMALVALMRVGPSSVDLSRLARLHADEQGAIQSLSFVLTIPIFLMVVMVIVQVSQIMVGRVVMEYVAFATARSAAVWIPARAPWPGEDENKISSLSYAGHIQENNHWYERYRVQPGPGKFERIELAAAIACLPISPSRFTFDGGGHIGIGALGALHRAYRALDENGNQTQGRIRNQLAYALESTEVEIEVHHKDTEPPLIWYDMPPDRREFADNETGWQDQLHVTVTHQFALLPGPARLLATRREYETSGSSIVDRGVVYAIAMKATVRMNTEGQKSVLPFTQPMPSMPSLPDDIPTPSPSDDPEAPSPSSLPQQPTAQQPPPSLWEGRVGAERGFGEGCPQLQTAHQTGGVA